MATKKITADWSETGKTIYCMIRREVDGYLLNDADGTFANNPSDKYLTLTEDSVIKGRYEASENRQTWNDGKYTIVVYKQSGASPSPADDAIIGSGDMQILNDAETDAYGIMSGANTELASVPNTASSLKAMIQFLFTYFRNKKTVTNTTETLMKEDASTTLGTASVSDNGTTFTKGEMN